MADTCEQRCGAASNVCGSGVYTINYRINFLKQTELNIAKFRKNFVSIPIEKMPTLAAYRFPISLPYSYGYSRKYKI
jgi:hypothetical protein